jgi:hypothetical protein
VTDEAERGGTRAAKRRRAGDLEVNDVGLLAVSRPWWRTLAKLGPRCRTRAESDRDGHGRVSDLMRWAPADRLAEVTWLPFAEQPGR